MKHQTNFGIPFFAALLLMIISCQKESAVPSPETLQNDTQLAQAEAAVAAAIAELEYDYENPAEPEGHTGTRATVYLSAGSVDGLSAAIAEAGPNGKIVVESGDHWESGTVTVPYRVVIEGMDGARLYVGVSGPGTNFPFLVTNVLDPAIYIKNAHMTRIKNLEILPQGEKGSVGILTENSRLVRIEACVIKNFQFGIWTSKNSNMARLYDNEVIGYTGRGVWGVVLESGKGAMVKGNYVTRYASNIFGSDENGIMKDNKMEGGFQGILLCTVQGNIRLPNGSLLQNALPARNWKLIQNEAHHNRWNYLLIDGANNNMMYRNEASNPGLYDVETAGETSRFGSFAPTSFDNFIINPNNSILTKICGEGNVALGGTKVNTSVDPCF